MVSERRTCEYRHASMDHVPDVVLMDILAYLPPHSFLPFAHVSRRFHNSWIEMKRTKQHPQRFVSSAGGDMNAEACKTNPLSIGNLFQSSWNSCTSRSTSSDNASGACHTTNSLNTKLLKYYVENGYGNLTLSNNGSDHGEGNMILDEVEMQGEEVPESNSNSDLDETRDRSASTDPGSGTSSSDILSKVMCETAIRGDIRGMNFMATHRYSLFDHENICTMAAAAGQLKALQWLRGDIQVDGCKDLKDCQCPWDPTEVHREAAENAHYDVVEYVERNSAGYNIQVHYGVGLPW